MNLTLHPCGPLRGELTVPGDKSITHRAFILGALAQGPSRVSRYLVGGDCQATVSCLQSLGIAIECSQDEAVIRGNGLHGLSEPKDVLNCIRSGTTLRLMAGILAGQQFYSVLSGADQLRRRPMQRVVEPLRQMGARIAGRDAGRLPPLGIEGSMLRAIDYSLPVASAQVKSCLLLAGLYATGEMRLTEPGLSRDHTERMLVARGVELSSILGPGGRPQHTLFGPIDTIDPLDTQIPADFSSAAFWIVGALLVPGSELQLSQVGINPTRSGLLDALGAMGANIESMNRRETGGEPVADLVIRGQQLNATSTTREIVPRMIDEFPILALAATQAQGITHVSGAEELRVKETDRIETTVQALRTLGARIEARPDGFDIEGPTPLRGAPVACHGDHRLALMLAIAGLVATGETEIEGAECIGDSYPGFISQLQHLLPEVVS